MQVTGKELAAAETLDRYVSRLLAGGPATLPQGVDPGQLRAYLMARELAHAGYRQQPQTERDGTCTVGRGARTLAVNYRA